LAILVTGGAGYIGSVTVELLRATGEQVVVVDNLFRGHREALDVDVPLYHGEAGDRELISRVVQKHGVKSCVHFAALAYVGESVQKPAQYFENNVAAGIALMGALVQAGVHTVVFSSTCATYGEPTQIPITEQAPQLPVNPYGWSKLIMERLLDSYNAAYGLKFVALRYFNAAGATEKCGEHHEPESHLIPNVLTAAADETATLPVFGSDYPTPDGTAIRDYTHVLDLADAHIRALAYLGRGGKSDFVNLGTGDGYSVLQVVEAARAVTGRSIRVRMEPRRPGDPPRLVADIAKAKAVLGWTPRQSDLESIIRSAWAWRLKNPHGYEARQGMSR
jgi:UDP-glucose 4-epimerase